MNVPNHLMEKLNNILNNQSQHDFPLLRLYTLTVLVVMYSSEQRLHELDVHF